MTKQIVSIENDTYTALENVEIEFPFYIKYNTAQYLNMEEITIQKVISPKRVDELSVILKPNSKTEAFNVFSKSYNLDKDLFVRSMYFPTSSQDKAERCDEQDWDWAFLKYKEVNGIQ